MDRQDDGVTEATEDDYDAEGAEMEVERRGRYANAVSFETRVTNGVTAAISF